MSTYDAYLSYTGFKTYCDCPQQYYQSYIEKKRPKIEDQRNVLNGNTLHGLLEQYILIGENNPKWLGENIRRVWRETLDSCALVTFRHNEDAQGLLDKAIKWTATLESLLVESKLDISKCEPELKADTIVQVGKHKVKMGARLDIVYKNSYNDYMFLDLKASENRQIMAFDQIVWYAIVLGEYLGDKTQPKYGGYVLPGFNELPVYSIPDAAKEKLLVRLEEVVTRIKAGVWTPNPDDKKCYWCPVKHVCPVKGALIPHGNGVIYLG